MNGCPTSSRPSACEPALHARVAAARLAWQFPYDAQAARATAPGRPCPRSWSGAPHDRLGAAGARSGVRRRACRARVWSRCADAGHYPYVELAEAFAQEVLTFAGGGS